MKKLFLLIMLLFATPALAAWDRGTSVTSAQTYGTIRSWLKLGTNPSMTSNGGHKFTVSFTVKDPKGTQIYSGQHVTYNNVDDVLTTNVSFNMRNLGTYTVNVVHSVYCPIGVLSATYTDVLTFQIGMTIHSYRLTDYAPSPNGGYDGNYTDNCFGYGTCASNFPPGFRKHYNAIPPARLWRARNWWIIAGQLICYPTYSITVFNVKADCWTETTDCGCVIEA